MLSTDFTDKNSPVRFPRINNKSKSLPSGAKQSSNLLESLTAKSWLYCRNNYQYGYKTAVKRDIASLTKIMTALCTIQICDKYCINIKSTYFKVTAWAATTIGTSAQLPSDAWISIQDLLYGMMLPSGNDAAAVLSQNLGAVLYFDANGNKELITCIERLIQIEIRSIDLSEDFDSIRFYNHEFITYMNERSKVLGMNKTRFANPHGLDHPQNYSCCEDVYLMIVEALKDEVFRKVVRTITYKAVLKYFRDGKVFCRPIFWTNTNRLLEKSEIYGIKTGITNKAGGCLATLLLMNHLNEALIIVLGSNSAESRFKDTLKIINWAFEQQAAV